MNDPLPDWDFNAISVPPPAPIVPLPAGAQRYIRGRRVIIGLPGLGWRGDMRADSPVVQGSRTYVPVLPEQEWYRAEAEQIEAFAPLVPIERVWVEVATQSSIVEQPVRDLIARLVSLDAPPRRNPVPAKDVATFTGRRVVTFAGSGSGGHQRDLRAVTEPYASSNGDICVRVARELDWYRWGWTGKTPKTLEVPVHLLWLE